MFCSLDLLSYHTLYSECTEQCKCQNTLEIITHNNVVFLTILHLPTFLVFPYKYLYKYTHKFCYTLSIQNGRLPRYYNFASSVGQRVLTFALLCRTVQTYCVLYWLICVHVNFPFCYIYCTHFCSFFQPKAQLSQSLLSFTEILYTLLWSLYSKCKILFAMGIK